MTSTSPHPPLEKRSTVILRRIAITLIVLACIVAVELAGAAFFSWSTGRLIYFNRPAAAQIQPATPTLEKHVRRYPAQWYAFRDMWPDTGA